MDAEIRRWMELRKKDRFAVALLLWNTACSDGEIKAIEVADIKQALIRLFKLNREEVDALISSVDRVKDEPEFLKRAVSDLSSGLPEELREEIFSVSCSIALSDRVICPQEKAFLNYLNDGLRLAA